ncbi:hypothetical protein GWK47_019414 [Chionoecetes opilio]|uniref:Uncharacterized protein n=1 Tax=Chionoecetes opilio TaxID=41210 RepID=A0A8J4XQC4_CHIOP|nr:hypothetical protein GWK47_019414 [Chionoecetes opilio]
MFAFIYLFTLSSILALDPSHLKPGALTAHLGQVSLVEDVLWVKYHHTALLKIPSRLREVTEQLNAALIRLEQELPKQTLRTDVSLDHVIMSYQTTRYLPLFHARLAYLNDTINLALHNYHGFDASHRAKRGFIIVTVDLRSPRGEVVLVELSGLEWLRVRWRVFWLRRREKWRCVLLLWWRVVVVKEAEVKTSVVEGRRRVEGECSEGCGVALKSILEAIEDLKRCFASEVNDLKSLVKKQEIEIRSLKCGGGGPSGVSGGAHARDVPRGVPEGDVPRATTKVPSKSPVIGEWKVVDYDGARPKEDIGKQ